MPRPPLLAGEERTARVLTEPHSPEKFRVNGVLFNIPEFYEAFPEFYEAFPEIRPGDALYREVEERPVIW
ncbi:hypothetical protein FGW20_05605 [Methanoculleus sp. FWC-SCC3]|uniref:Peptidase M13 C-terminal domain-containing protein n=1 Tax=Methanoculleus methanifontis TaxID=2584086 RepID=A0ABT8M0H4_9EURY|nr:M13-type metalloendopeptidase [Methanoculleus sp. FWC-SCC3]MDN7012523.1 hypothetical protein [Methanoculleus sp. FWC-SCC3]